MSEQDAARTRAGEPVEDHRFAALRASHFADRRDAGRQLATRLARFRGERPVVVAMPRGGVPVAVEVARALAAPLDVVVVRKVGAPRNREFAIGAVAEGGVHVLSERAVSALGLSERALQALLAKAEREVAECLERYRGQRAPLELRARTVILVDDGLATGRSARAAIVAVRQRGARRVILAVPVAARRSARALRAHADEVVWVKAPRDMQAVGTWYENFLPTEEQEVAALLSL